MRRILLLGLFVVASCGGTTAPEPWAPPSAALDLNATSYTLQVYAKPAVINGLGGRTITRLEVVARMRDAKGYAPSVKLPSDLNRPLVVEPLVNGVQPDGSGQDTERVVLNVYPEGYIAVQVRAIAGGEVVGMMCPGEKSVSDQGDEIALELPDPSRPSCL